MIIITDSAAVHVLKISRARAHRSQAIKLLNYIKYQTTWDSLLFAASDVMNKTFEPEDMLLAFEIGPLRII
jgi:hypothetical protein